VARERFKLVQRAGVTWLQSSELERLPWLAHGFSTRLARPPAGQDRECPPPARDFNLGFTDGARQRDVRANRRHFLEALAGGFTAASLRQIHSATIYQVAKADVHRSERISGVKGLEYLAAGCRQPGLEAYAGPGIAGANGERHPAATISEPLAAGDALVTAEPGILLTVRTADCLPVLLVDRRLRVMAAVHAGWRGALARVVEKTAGELRRLFNSRPADLAAAIGPGISRCCYEVGDEVVDAFRGQFVKADRFFHRPPASSPRDRSDLRYTLLFHTQAPPGHRRERAGLHLDLVAVARAQLLAAGLKSSAIDTSGYCTACRADLFFSHRREGVRAGRMMAAIGLRP
jgi:purine-nucleoside/S-methyl-5'-thioadenosine phosphorylase / adenosine deaminase